MDKREAVRVPVRVHARCRLDTGVVVDGLVEDVSRSGMFLVVEDESTLACGSSTSIAMELPGQALLQFEAEVVRRVGGSGIGLRFRAGTEPSRRPLANFIMKQAFDRQH